MKPKISLFTSLFKGSEHLRGFLEDIEGQTMFKECELVIIGANSPEKEEEEAILQPYLHKYRGHGNGLIRYLPLDYDPGVYAVWNLCIKECSSELLSNANVDDRKHPEHLEKHYEALQASPDVDLAYADIAVTYKPNETFEKNSAVFVQNFPEYSFLNLLKCNMPHNNPVWRRSIHEKNGFFREDMISASDFDMWLRAATNGSKFKRVDGVLSLYYKNPEGISTKGDTLDEAVAEVVKLREEYSYKVDYRELTL